jgi:hypothetical protein
MIGYTLKHVLELVPEALDLVKQASVEQDYPINNKDGCIASGLAVAYKTRISGQMVDYDNLEKVSSAITAYNLGETVNDLVGKMVGRSRDALVKQASFETPDTYMTKQAGFEGDLTGFMDLQEIVKQAEVLAEQAAGLGVNPSLEVRRYACDAFLAKEAALGALGARFQATKNPVFVKLAAALSKEAEIIPPSKLTKSLCSTVTGLDKEAGLLAKGFNFYKEALIEKEAAVNSMMVKVAGKDYALQRILALPANYVDDYLGKGFMKEATSDPGSTKAMIESLPLDSQHVLATILKNAG